MGVNLKSRFHLCVTLLISAGGICFEVTAQSNNNNNTGVTQNPAVPPNGCTDAICPPGSICIDLTQSLDDVDLVSLNESVETNGSYFTITRETCRSCLDVCNLRNVSRSSECIDLCTDDQDGTSSNSSRTTLTSSSSGDEVPPLNLAERIVCGSVAFLLALLLCVVVRKACTVIERRMGPSEEDEVMAIIDNAEDFDSTVDLWTRPPPRRSKYVRTVSHDGAPTSTLPVSAETDNANEDSNLRDWGSRPTETSSGGCTSPSYGATSVAVIDATTVEIHV